MVWLRAGVNCSNLLKRFEKSRGMAYQLWVTGRHDLSGRIFSNIRDTALALRVGLNSGSPLDFTVQCYSPDGKFARGFGGTVKLNGDSGIEVKYNNGELELDDEKLIGGMKEFKEYLTFRYSRR